MSWSYSGDPSTSPLDEARFTVGDTKESEALFSDEEIQYMVDHYSSKAALYYHMFLQAATNYSKAIRRTLGPQTEDPSSRTDYFSRMADMYRKEMLVNSSSSALSVPRYQYPKIFHKGMQSNPPFGTYRRFV